jgi:hypothetical protein
MSLDPFGSFLFIAVRCVPPGGGLSRIRRGPPPRACRDGSDIDEGVARTAAGMNGLAGAQGERRRGLRALFDLASEGKDLFRALIAQ